MLVRSILNREETAQGGNGVTRATSDESKSGGWVGDPLGNLRYGTLHQYPSCVGIDKTKQHTLHGPYMKGCSDKKVYEVSYQG